jgi:hypothetical protein
MRLHRNVRPHKGIIICTDDPDVFALATRIHDALVGCATLEGVTRVPLYAGH